MMHDMHTQRHEQRVVKPLRRQTPLEMWVCDAIVFVLAVGMLYAAVVMACVMTPH